MQTGSNGQRHGAAKAATRKPGIRAKRRALRAILREGLEAALRADPEVLEKCKPRTGAGRVVRGLVLEAGKGKTTPLKTLMSLVDWEEGAESEEIVDETHWDWSPEGVWETMPEAEPESELAEEEEGPAKQELRHRFERLMGGNEADQAR